ncbi:uncharacterized protein [Clytia hemisphaerica]|uniref:Ion transport domain-containing protein n=1 Tax=Clytia hemisphaerica TaxID=252671 RepID=A0A7M5WIS9_9CNID|eukprot:TCONS_00022337-protein
MLNPAYSDSSESDEEDFLHLTSLNPDQEEIEGEEIYFHQLPKDKSKWKTRKVGYNAGQRRGPCPRDDVNEEETRFTKIGSLERVKNNEVDIEEPLANIVEEESSTIIHSSIIAYFASLADKKETFDYTFVETLLKMADVNSVDVHGQTLLHEVAREWNVDVAQFLFQQGIMIDVADKYGRTPLMVAASSNNVEMMTWLVNNGADKRKKSNGIEAKEPIHYAAMFDALDAVKLLISMDVSADQPDNLYQTPLFIAARNGATRVCSYLMECELPVATYTTYGSSPIEQIVSNMPSEIALLALDQFVVVSKENRNSQYYLANFGKKKWHVINQKRASTMGRVIYPTVIESIIRKKDYELITHPSILHYIQQCSSTYGEKYIYTNAILNVLYTAVWTGEISSHSLSERSHQHAKEGDFASSYILLLLGLALSFIQAIMMFREVKFDQHHQSRLIENRLTMLEKRLEDAHPRWSLEKNLILNEKEACIKEKVSYWSDGWVYIDLVALIMTVVYALLIILTQVLHDRKKIFTARIYYSIVLLFVVWIRMNRSLLIFQWLGAFINMFVLSIKSIVQFSFLFMIFYIPFSVLLAVAFGGNKKKIATTSDNYKNFNDGMYQLFLLTVVSDYDLDTLVGMNKAKAQVGVAFYIIIVSVIFLNLYVALLSETFVRVYGNATAMSLVSKAKKMLSIEIASSHLEDAREDHLYKQCNPLIVALDNEQFESTQSTKAIAINAKKRIKGLALSLRGTGYEATTINKDLKSTQLKYKEFSQEYRGTNCELPQVMFLAREQFNNPWFKTKVAKEKLMQKKTKAMIEVPIAFSRMGEAIADHFNQSLLPSKNRNKKP